MHIILTVENYLLHLTLPKLFNPVHYAGQGPYDDYDHLSLPCG